MKVRPLVSVIIAAFNAEDYIVRAISSVLSQTMTRLEIIVVDDASTDDTISKIQGIHDDRIRLYAQACNRGPSFCRNYAIEYAQGDWVAILDSDDWWDSRRLDALLECAVHHQAQIVCDDLYLIKDGSSTPHNTYLRSRETVIGRVTELTTVTPMMMINDDYGVLQPLIRADFLRENSIRYKVSHRFGEDFVFLLDCLTAGAKLVLYPVPYYYYRTGHASLSASTENPMGQCSLLEELISTPPYDRMPQIRQALEGKLHRKRLIFDQFHVKTAFQQKRVWEGTMVFFQHPGLIVGFVRSLKNKVTNILGIPP